MLCLRATRNDEDGEARLWYWQLEGRRWNLDGKTFDTAKKAYGRLVATDEERTEATAARYGRATSEQERRDEKEASLEAEKRQRAEAEIAERQARRWRQLCGILRRANLERVATHASALHRDGLLSSLYEPPSECAPHGSTRIGLFGAVTAFLNNECGHELDKADGPAASLVASLNISREEAAMLHCELTLAHFQKFVDATLSSLEVMQSDGDSLLSAEACFDLVYEACKQAADGSWRRDLDVPDRIGAMWAGYDVAASAGGGCAPPPPPALLGERRLDEVLAGSVLCDAAAGFLRFAYAQCCLRAVLIETLTRGTDGSMWKGHQQMYKLLQSSKLGIAEGEFSSVVWFIGQMEHSRHGRLWARMPNSMYPAAPQYLCALARGSNERVSALANVLRHSVVLREPLRLFLDAHWQGFACRAWLHPPGWKHKPDYLDGSWTRVWEGGLDAHLRAMCEVLASVAIKLPGCISTEHLSTVLLTALGRVALGWAEGDAATQKVVSALRGACRVPYEIPMRHRCDTCETRASKITEWNCCSGDRESWDAFMERARGNVGSAVPSLQSLCLDVMRRQEMERLSLTLGDVAVYQTKYVQLVGARNNPTPRQCVRQSLHQLITARCPHKTIRYAVVRSIDALVDIARNSAHAQRLQSSSSSNLSNRTWRIWQWHTSAPSAPSHRHPQHMRALSHQMRMKSMARAATGSGTRFRSGARKGVRPVHARALIWAPFAFP